MKAKLDQLKAGEGPVKVLLIHGSGSGARALSRLAELISSAVPDCEAVSIGLAGYGSVAADPSLPIVEQHLDVIADAMADHSWHLVGHSMGGYLALQTAMREPRQIRSLSLVEPIALGVLDPTVDADAIAEDRSIIEAFAAGREDGSGVARFIESWNQSDWQDLPEALRSRLTAMAAQIYDEALAVSHDGCALSVYEQIERPILLACGTGSPLPVRRVTERLSSLLSVAAVNWIEDAGHMAVVRRPEAFAADIARHIQSVPTT